MINLERTTGSRRVGWISLLGALLVPIMLAGGFLAATWDSSSRWDKVQAAIVNTDKPVTINGQTVPLGRQLASGLVKGGDDGPADDHGRQNFDWVISDAGDASDGLGDGRYAAVVTIPANFSRAATSYSHNKGDRAEQATLDVQTSKVSGVTDAAIAQAISSAAVSSLNNQLTKQYLDNLYLGFNQTQQGVRKSADGASSVSDGVDRLSDGIGRSATGARQLTSGLDQLSDGTGQLSDGIAQTDTGAAGLADGISGLHDGIARTNTGVAALDAGVGKLADGMDSYTDGVRTYAEGVKKYTNGVGRLTDSLAPYATGVGSYVDGVDQYSSGVDRYVDGVDQYVTGVGSIAEAVGKGVSDGATPDVCRPEMTDTECQYFIAGMQQGAAATASGITTQAASAADRLTSSSRRITGGGDRLTRSGKVISRGSEQLSTAAGSIGDAGDQLATGATGLSGGAKKINKGLAGLHDATGKLAGGTQKLQKAAAQLDTGAQQLAVGIGQLDDAGKQLAAGTTQSVTGADQLSDGLSRLHDGAEQLADGADQLASGLTKAADQIPTYSGSDRKQLSDVASAPVTGDQPDGLFANATTTTLLLALALWIGGLATYLIVRAVSSEAFGSQKSSLLLALEGVAPGVIIGAVQAVLLSIMLSVMLDLSVGRGLGLLTFSTFAAVTFAVLNQALVGWLGGIGRFVSLAVVVMAAAGSLTNAVPGFFAGVRPYLPITPALDGVRMIVTGHTAAGHQVAVLVGWLVIGFLASLLAVARRRVATTTSLGPARTT
ncbi:YhgE/Pip domain-containing protein [Microlunatus sp. Gsoil 973]|uniref:YhgE/Pip domain-containing protein n=1 Tax=Microlunatus sp. Gsoil 973 TaxID=2672569 RepID=UPI0012B4D416|nr:YhgE/Pip domain-containing protein [Microlunatus sp. Gsoil 973]QGN34649.1 hypothetical protein GJV80_19505 [Microlunatus sp. Gsoil 973]